MCIYPYHINTYITDEINNIYYIKMSDYATNKQLYNKAYIYAYRVPLVAKTKVSYKYMSPIVDPFTLQYQDIINKMKVTRTLVPKERPLVNIFP
jgi:hypothetical protein